jgi:predicted phage-related endonuclease
MGMWIKDLMPYKTALAVQQEKIGPNEPDESEALLLRLGLLMEPVILRLYYEATGVKPRVPRKTRILRHPEHNWMLCTLDARAGSPAHPLEVKNVLFPRGKWGKGEEEIPDEYMLQVQHQLAITGADYCELPVLIYGRFRIYKVQRNERLIERIIEREKEFWEKHVLAAEPVKPDFKHSSTLDLLKAMYGAIDGVVELGEEEAHIAAVYQELGKQIYSLGKDRDECQAKLLAAMQSAGFAELPNGMKLLRQKIDRKGYSVEPSSYVRLTVK